MRLLISVAAALAVAMLAALAYSIATGRDLGELAKDVQRRTMNDKQLGGTINEAVGRVKEGVGDLIGDSDLKTEGQADQLKGKAQRTAGDAQESLQRTGDAVKQALEPES
jgi:uncharacterized protein YjbJ (UPF0337 family)